MYDILELNDKLVSELKEIARLMNLPNYDEFRKQELIYKILDQQALHPEESKNIRDALTAKSPAKNTKPEKIEKADKVESVNVYPLLRILNLKKHQSFLSQV